MQEHGTASTTLRTFTSWSSWTPLWDFKDTLGVLSEEPDTESADYRCRNTTTQNKQKKKPYEPKKHHQPGKNVFSSVTSLTANEVFREAFSTWGAGKENHTGCTYSSLMWGLSTYVVQRKSYPILGKSNFQSWSIIGGYYWDITFVTFSVLLPFMVSHLIKHQLNSQVWRSHTGEKEKKKWPFYSAYLWACSVHFFPTLLTTSCNVSFS